MHGNKGDLFIKLKNNLDNLKASNSILVGKYDQLYSIENELRKEI
jgi:hypothetical protein